MLANFIALCSESPLCLVRLRTGEGLDEQRVNKKLLLTQILVSNRPIRRSQWPCGLRRGSAVAGLLGLWVRIPPGAWMFFSCECCVLSGRGLCDGLVPRPEESYRMWCVSKNSVIVKPRKMRRSRPPRGGRATGKKAYLFWGDL
jgi:hypothetical protein